MIVKKINNEEGLTLIELILAITIFSLIILALNSFFISFYNNWRDSNIDAQIIEDLNFAENMLSRDIREAIKPAEDIRPIEVESDGKSFNLYRILSDPNTIYDIKYEISNGKLYRKMREFSSGHNLAWERNTLILEDLEGSSIFEDIGEPGTIPRLIRVVLVIERETRVEELKFTAMSRSRGN